MRLLPTPRLRETLPSHVWLSWRQNTSLLALAYYPIVLIADPGSKTKDPLRNYFIEVRYKGKQNKLLGKPELAAVAKKPTRGIPYTGLWSNEPYPTQTPNAEMVGRDLTREPTVGDKIKYSLKATKTIREGEEVMWCYGTEFDRGSPPYKTGCPV